MSYLLVLLLAVSAEITGVVEDPSGRGVPAAEVRLLSADGAVVARQITGPDGSFRFAGGPEGALLTVHAAGFQPHRQVAGDPAHRIRLALATLQDHVTVTGLRGPLSESTLSPHVVGSISEPEGERRGHPTIAQAIAGTAGVHMQQSATGQASPFLRGFTGFHVLQVVDGIRYNNSTFRFGPNQYLALLEPSQAQRVEVTLGPAAVEYGSDALGGALQVALPQPALHSGSGWNGRGRVSGFLGSADLSAGGATQASVANQRAAFLFGGSWRHFNDLRAGGGADSRHALRRFFGLSNSQIRGLLGDRQLDTGFGQFGGLGRVHLRLAPDQQFSFAYHHSTQRGVRGYKDLWGGQGRLQSAFLPQSLNLFYARYEKQGRGWLDAVSGTFSINSQRDGSQVQALLRTDPVLTDRTRVDSYGYAGQVRGHRGSRQTFLAGGEFYDEHIRSLRLFTPAGGRARYGTLGAFGQTSWESSGQRWRLSGGGRVTRVTFGDRLFSDLTFHAAATTRLAAPLRWHAVVSRGFRAPNLNDLATLGLQDLGFEIPAEAAAPAGALVGSNSGEAAVSSGVAVKSLGSERLLNYESGFSWQRGETYLRAQAFDAELYDAIARRTLLFPVDHLPARIAGLPVTPVTQSAEQRAQGLAGVATAFDPRAVKAFVNAGRQRYAGIEWLLRQKLTAHWSLALNYSFLAARDLYPSQPLRRLPPQQGVLSAAWRGSRWWMEWSLEVAGAQRRLNGGDLGDERIGAERSRADIARFFAGDRVRPWISGSVFVPTGESLAQIQQRVLPGAVSDTVRVPLYRAHAGFAAVHVRAGRRFGERHTLTVSAFNLTDRNYRHHGSGVDAPGLHVIAGWEVRF